MKASALSLAGVLKKCIVPCLTGLFITIPSFGEADTTQIPPATTMWGTIGLTQTASAESQGTSRLTFGVTGTWYKQETSFAGAPNAGAHIGTGTLAASYAANNFIELFGTVSGFGTTKYANGTSSGLGAITAGAQGMLPLPAQAPFRLGAQAVIIGGTSQNQINKNNADGFNYFETRTGYDIMGRAIESFVLGNDYVGFKIMLNEGFVTSIQASQANLMLLSAGLQAVLARYYIIGFEANSRTYLNDIQLQTDPLWLTPSLTFRTPYFVSFTLGADISLSEDRTSGTAVRALEQYRLFGRTTFSVDVLARKRKEAAEKQQQERAEKTALESKAKNLQTQADSLSVLTKEARENSLAQKRMNDSLAQVAAKLTERTKADSIALAESQKKLDEERAKRSDAEKQLLSTGMLILDAVYFESGKAEISMNSKPYLTIIAKMLAKYPKLHLEVGGHTDNVGTYTKNMQLSQWRADAVQVFLMSIEPTLSGKLTSMGYGPTLPKAPNTTADGRKINRRVELQVTNKEVLKEYNP
jgi:outer membrane protein OmpA-like peptidoglycan-associated protein